MRKANISSAFLERQALIILAELSYLPSEQQMGRIEQHGKVLKELARHCTTEESI